MVPHTDIFPHRERLLGQWGVVDVRDALTAVREYGALGMLDPSRAMIRGGGPTVLSALAAAPDAFLAGTSIAGVSDLLSLQAKLPKFESHHLVKYVGGSPEEDWRLWWDRSPISRAGDIRAPLLVSDHAMCLERCHKAVMPAKLMWMYRYCMAKMTLSCL